MKRREFLQSGPAAATVAAMAATIPATLPARAAAPEDAGPAGREFYELRLYRLKRGPMVTRFDDFHREVALPAWARAGIGTVGVFDVLLGPDQPAKYVLLSAGSPGALLAARERFEADPAVAGAAFTALPATDPGYVRKECRWLRAFRTLPRLELPALSRERRPRIFELRTYEAHSRRANLKKIEMFDAGEIAIFRRTGLTPVFFGEDLTGASLPSLTYLLVFGSLADRERHWATFAADPEWKKLSSTPGFTDPEIVTNITSVLLRPTAYSPV